MTSKTASLSVLALMFLGCSPRTRTPDTGMLPNWADGGVDAPGADASRDAPTLDAAMMITMPDTGSTAIDAGRDAGMDAGSDAGRDAGSDAGRDAGSDAGRDGGSDAGPSDAGPSDAFIAPDTNSDVGCTPLPTGATTITGTLPSGLTFARPLGGCGTLSSVGTAVPYRAYTFCNADGARLYSFALNNVGGALDPFVVVYRGMGSPSSLMCIASDDDGGPSGSDSLATATIAAGEMITVIATGFDNDESGDYALVITPL